MEHLIHLFIPRFSNNHKAKILHPSSLLILAVFVIFFQNLIDLLPVLKPNILGFSAQISPEEIVRLTNIKRSQAGVPPLTYNQTLSNAAYTKARDMIDRDYWAHVAPDGTQPWSFFSKFGYRYRYAGENLARDFQNPSSTVDAWMNSPTHRDNILNPKYKEIGVGVSEGDLAGIDTTIIVQFFGATYADKVVSPVAKVETVSTPIPTSVPDLVINVSGVDTSPRAERLVNETSSEVPRVLISPFNTSRVASIGVVAVLFGVFIIDALIVSRRRIVRIAGRSFAHAAFLGLILTIILIIKSGKIL